MTDLELIKKALEARKKSYCPYSNFAVGAALLCKDGSVFLGCNIENAAYGPSNCAERTAIFKAVSEGNKEFEKIAIVGGNINAASYEYCAPCGVCRQVMREFVDPQRFQIILGKEDEEYKIFTLAELFPEGFGPENLKNS